jgi:hypothetical protein
LANGSGSAKKSALADITLAPSAEPWQEAVDALIASYGSSKTLQPSSLPHAHGSQLRLPAAVNLQTGQAPGLFLRVSDSTTRRSFVEAVVYANQPPFPLDAHVIDYFEPAPGQEAVEVFIVPPGWGVLRSSQGLLLWLQLQCDGILQVEGSLVDTPGARFALSFEAEHGSTNVGAESCGRAQICSMLGGDEGLLRSGSGRPVRIQLASNFDTRIKVWLARHRASFQGIQK